MLKKILAPILAGVMVVGCLTACGNSEPAVEEKSETVETSVVKDSEEVEEPKGDPTNLILFNVTNELAADHDLVWGKINEILLEKLNVTVEYRNISWAEYKDKYPMIISSGEQVDILYCMNGTWQGYAEKGAFMDLTDLAPKYAPNLYGSLTEDQIVASTLHDKMWILPPHYIFTSINGVAVRGDLMDKYGIEDIITPSDFLEYLKVVYENEEGFALFTDNNLNGQLQVVDAWQPVPSTENLVWFDSSEGADPSVLQFSWEHEKSIDKWKVLNEANEAGVMPKDAVMSEVSSQDAFVEGTMPAAAINSGNYSSAKVWGKIQEEHPEWDPRWYYFYPEESRLISPISNGWVIPATAKNPELSLQVMDLLAMDEELHDLVNYGIEGTHYVVNEKGELDLPEGKTAETKGYSGYGTIHVNEDYMKNTVGTWPELNETVASYIENGHISPLAGFSLDTSKISTELANMAAIWNEYNKSMHYGILPVDETIEEIKTAMEAAGCEKVREEVSAQIAAFLNK